MRSISDVIGASGLEGYAEVALVIFLVVFMAITLRVLFTKSADLEHVSRLPLDDDSGSSPARDEGAAT
jgi:hypothetical protein